MRAIEAPEIDVKAVYFMCIDSISDKDLKKRLADVSRYIEDAAADYDDKSETMDFYLIESKTGNLKSIVVGKVTKKELKNVYEKYMVPITKPARKIYDKIKIGTKKCPYCGFGQAATLDHYLPKSKFPLLCVTPTNLVPACRDCNSGSKKAALATTKGAQHLHPYFDRGIYIDDQWLSAKVIKTRPLSVKYFVDPPAHWSDEAKERVSAHFKDFNLAKRYGDEASDEISAIRLVVEDCFRSGGAAAVRDEMLRLSRPAEKIFINSWRTAFYQALANSVWYCNGGFNV